MPIKPEFIGLYLLLLKSKIIAWRVITIILLIGVIAACGQIMRVQNELRHARYDMAEGNNIDCPGAIAKVVNNGRVTCVMQRLGVGQRTYEKELRK